MADALGALIHVVEKDGDLDAARGEADEALRRHRGAFVSNFHADLMNDGFVCSSRVTPRA
jgi:hypothetical protein